MAIRRLRSKLPSIRLLIVLLVAVGLLMFALSRCSRPAASVAGFVKPGGDTLCVAIELSPVSHNLSSNNGEAGYYYDVIQAISRQQKRPIVIVPVSIEEGLRGLDDGLYDLLVADIPSTVAQKEKYLFTEPINLDRQVLVQIPDADGRLRYETQFDLAGDTVYIAHGSAFATRIKHLSNEIGDTIFVVEDPQYGQEQMIMMAAAGELPNVVVNERQARAMTRELPGIDYSVVLSLNQLQSWVMNKADSTRLDTINSYIRQFMASPEATRIADAYGY